MIEAAGIPTTSISLVREHTAKIKPPRALWVPFPFGHAFGRPNDPATQHAVLAAALALFSATSGPVLVDFTDAAGPAEPAAPVQASAVPTQPTDEDAAMETTRMRQYHAVWVERTGRTAVGLTGIPVTRFRGVIRFLEAIVAGAALPVGVQPEGMALPAFIRASADDLKALYWEARLVMKPDDSGAEIARWFWGETATGQLLRRLKDTLEQSDDPALKAMGFGVAR